MHKNLLPLMSNHVTKRMMPFVVAIVVCATTFAQTTNWQTQIRNKKVFIENKNQFNGKNGLAGSVVLFGTENGSSQIFFTNKGLTYSLVKKTPKHNKENEERERRPKDHAEMEREEHEVIITKDLVQMQWENSNPDVKVVASDIATGYQTFIINGKSVVAQCYKKLVYQNLYPGIDVEYTFHPTEGIEYSFIVHPGADYKDINIQFLNAQRTSLIENDTKLKIQTIAGNIEEGNIRSYTGNDKMRSEVLSKYVIKKDNLISFEIGDYDSTKPLTIDPLVWATYYGGTSFDGFRSICSDNQDNIYISGYSTSTDLPMLQLTGAYWQTNNIATGYNDAYIIKFNNQGVRQWATFYGGTSDDKGYAISADSQDNIYVTGYTNSHDFPTQQLTGAYWQSTNFSFSGSELYILKFNTLGERLWATYYGGSSSETAYSMCVDSLDNV